MNDKEMSYACYLQGIKRHFRTIGLSTKQIMKVEKLIEQSDNKRTDVKRIHIKYTKDQLLGYKLEKIGNQASSPKRIRSPLPLCNDDGFMAKLDLKRSTAPILMTLVEPTVKEISDKYAPLYELKMQSKIEGIEIGLEQTAIEHKREH